MSCSFWLRRKKKAAQRREQEAITAPAVETVEEKAEPAEKKPTKKAVKADEPKAD